MRRFLVAALLFVLLSSAAGPAGGAAGAAGLPRAAGTTRVLTCSGRTAVKPANYLLSCADANASWKKVRWSSWGEKSGLGKGELYQNDCTPNCAAGRFRTYPATVRLSRVVESRSFGPLFSVAVFHYAVQGKKRAETFDLVTTAL